MLQNYKKNKKLPSCLTFPEAGTELVKIHRLRNTAHIKAASPFLVPIALNKAK